MSSTNYDDRIEEAINTFSQELLEIEEAFQNRDVVLESFLISQLKVNFFDKNSWIPVVHAVDVLYGHNRAFNSQIYDKFLNVSLQYEMFRQMDRKTYNWRYLHAAYEYCRNKNPEKVIPFLNKYMKGKCTIFELLQIFPAYKEAIRMNGLYDERSMSNLDRMLTDPDNRRELGQKLAKHFEGLETALKQLEFRLNRLGSKNDNVVMNQDNQSDHLTEIKLQALIAFYNKYKWDIPKAQRLPHGHWDFLALNTNNQQNGGFFITGNVYNTPDIFHIRYQGTNKIVHIYPKNETRTFQTFDEIVQFLNQRFP